MSDPRGRQVDEILAPYGPPVPSLLPWAARWAPRHDLFMIAETAAGQVASTPSVRWPAVADAVAEVLGERAGADPELIATLPRVLPSVAAHFDPAQLEILLAGPASTDALCYAALGHPGSRLLEEHRRRPAGADWTAILSARRPGGADPLPPLANFRLLTQLARQPAGQLADGPDLVYLFPFQRSQRRARRQGEMAVTEIEEYIPTRVPWYAAALCARVAPFLDDAQRSRLAGSARAASSEAWARLLYELARYTYRPWVSATAEIDASHPAVRQLNELAEVADLAELAEAGAWIAGILFERFGGPRPELGETISRGIGIERYEEEIRVPSADLYAPPQGPLSVPSAAEPEGDEPSRHVNVLLAEAGTDQPLPAGRAWRAGIAYDLLVSIGRQAEESLLPGRGSRFPEELLPGGGLWLRAVLSWPSGSPAVLPIYLPPEGESFSCTCPFDGEHQPGCERLRWARFQLPDPVPDAGLDGELVIYYEAAAVVVVRILLPAGSADGGVPRAELAGRLTTTFTDLGSLAGRSASVVASPGYSHLTVNGASFLDTPFAASAGPGDVAVKIIRNVLYDMHFDTQDDVRRSRLDRSFGKTQAAFEADLRLLARFGAQLYGALFMQPGSDRRASRALPDLLRNEARLRGHPPVLQVIDQRFDDAAVPWALVYDLPVGSDTSEYELCRSVWEFGPERGRPGVPPPCCPYPHPDDAYVLCLYGFWGFSCVLDQPVLADATPARVVYPDPGALCWMLISDPVPENNVIADHLTRLKTARAGVLVTQPPVQTARMLGRELEPETADVVYFYCHCGYETWYTDAATDRYLKIGDFRIRALDLETWARQMWREPHWPRRRPLVVLNGCHTIEATTCTLNSFVPAFIHNARAAGVVGTEITVEQGFACLVGEQLLPLLAAGQGVGEALRSVRWDLLRRGNVLGLAYTPFCLANLTLRP
jgi:hypothetical protein